MSDFFHCPALDFEIAMISIEETKTEAFKHETNGCAEHHADEYNMHDLLFGKIETLLDKSQKIVFNEPTKVFCLKSSFKD